MKRNTSQLNLDKNEESIKWMRKVMKDKSIWPKSYPILLELLNEEDDKVKDKALFILGEVGLKYPNIIEDIAFEKILTLMDSEKSKTRERAVGALGRIGRSNGEKVKKYIPKLLSLSRDESSNVRMNMIWASENIATNSPSLFENHMDIFSRLLDDEDERVRMEAPEIFRVMGKRKPDTVYPYKEKLIRLSKEDKNRVVRVHAEGALKNIK